MPANTSLELTSLDFDTQKASLLNYLRSQDLFRDYDFEGSNLNVLIDLLTYNTHKNAFYLNMALSEGFLDSAQLHASVLSHAKELNYLPRSARSSKARVRVDFGATSDHQPYIIQKGQSFTAAIKNNSFLFSIPETITCASSNTSFSFTTDIYEGAYVKESFVFETNTGLPLRFKLTNNNPDIDSLVVNIFEDSNIQGVIYRRVLSLLDLTEMSKVYFVQTSAVDGFYEIMFGDGVVGYQPKNGSLVVLDYRITAGSESNGAGRFSINFDPTSPFAELVGDMDVTVLATAMGGDEGEDIETTRFYAPRWFQTQERAIVPTDYKVLMQIQFPEIHAINVYGGEQLAPPQFGKVIVALEISNVDGLPQSKLDQYYKFLKARCPLTIIPIFIEPEYTYVKITTLVRYNVNVTSESVSRIRTIVLSAISEFNTEFLDDFDATFRFSKFQRAIDDSDVSIVSNLTDISVYKKFYPLPNISGNFFLNFAMPLRNDMPATPQVHRVQVEKVLRSTSFSFETEKVSLEDDGFGSVRIVKRQGDTITFVKNVGAINYDTGVVALNDFKVDAYDGPAICLYVQPREMDVSCSLNTILLIETDAVDITVEQIRD